MNDDSRWRSVAADLDRARTATGRSTLGAFRVEGLRLVERALRAGLTFRVVAAGGALLDATEARPRAIVEALARRGVTPVRVPAAEATVLTDGRGEGEIAALVDCPPDAGTAGLAAADAIALVAVDVEDPGNVGALARTALASGCALLVTAGRGDPYHPRAVRISRGAVFRLPIARFADPARALAGLREGGARLVGTVLDPGAAPLAESDLTRRPLAVVVGNEARGLEPDLAARLHASVTIPMGPGVDSFSVNAAAAIVLWEARRSR